MAFNPFHSFRRHQKVIFAGLTIVCMGIFVISSGMGGGDIFNQLTGWMSNRSRTHQAAKLYGHDVDEMTIAMTQRRRQLANDYMQIVTQRAAARSSSTCRRRPTRWTSR